MVQLKEKAQQPTQKTHGNAGFHQQRSYAPATPQKTHRTLAFFTCH
jgi:hypothetical protein